MINQQVIAAKPTKYKDVTFRSKSEARFAVMLELAGIKWCYEPIHNDPDLQWKPDFLCEFPIRNGSTSAVLVEYKPTEPNPNYKEWWFNEAINSLEGSTILSGGSESTIDAAVLLWGSWFNGINGFDYINVIVNEKKAGSYWSIVQEYFADKFFGAMKFKHSANHYRFDL